MFIKDWSIESEVRVVGGLCEDRNIGIGRISDSVFVVEEGIKAELLLYEI